jgi:hypothetical protein
MSDARGLIPIQARWTPSVPPILSAAEILVRLPLFAAVYSGPGRSPPGPLFHGRAGFTPPLWPPAAAPIYCELGRRKAEHWGAPSGLRPGFLFPVGRGPFALMVRPSPRMPACPLFALVPGQVLLFVNSQSVRSRGPAYQGWRIVLPQCASASISDACVMRAFVYACPTTEMKVQGWAAESPAANDHYEAVQCTACKRFHLVSPISGRVAGEGSSRFGEWRKDD